MGSGFTGWITNRIQCAGQDRVSQLAGGFPVNDAMSAPKAAMFVDQGLAVSAGGIQK
jgi:hypothetical protein